MPITISFVIPLYNHLAESQVMLFSLLESLPIGLSYEVILVDDASTDKTRDWLSGLSLPHTRVLINEHNQGFAKTTNRGAAEAVGDFLCLLNNDLIFEPGWLEPMLALLASVPLRAGVVGNVQYRVADGQVDHAGVYLSQRGAFMHKQPLQLPCREFDKQIAVTGACVLLARNVFDQVSGFDERYINGCEDIDLCYKLRALGLSVLVSYESRIKHHVSLSRGCVSLKNERNSQVLFAKWRKEIKQDLVGVWLPFLQAGRGWPHDLLPGVLSPEFLNSPYTAARIIAESVIARLEAYWQRTLLESGEEVPKLAVRGLRAVPGQPFYAVIGDIEIQVGGLRSSRNFYVCGFKPDPNETRQVAVSFEVNGIQTVFERLGPEQSVNVGVVNPLWLTGVPNRIRVTFLFIDDEGVGLGPANAAVYLTHVVVDDQVIKP